MRIALDATYSTGRNLSGVGVYSREILEGLATAYPDARYKWCYRPHRFLRGLRDRAPSNVSRRLLWRGWRPGADLFHALNQRVETSGVRRVVTTFHDLFVITGEYSTREFRARFAGQARAAAERSDLVIAVSQFTANQVEDILKVPRSRIRVIHHGVKPAAALSDLSSRTILFVGALQKRKNVVRLVKAFEQVGPGWKLVLAGSMGYGADEITSAIAGSPRRVDIAVPGYVSATTLEHLYRTASIFAFPSLDEGFGMPVLEAMAHGIPVLTSMNSALGEISGQAAMLIDPRDVNAIADGLRQLTEGTAIRQHFGKAGLAHSSEFSWKLAVDRTWATYKELCG